MLKEARSFVESLLEESNTNTIKNALRAFNLPLLLERTLTEVYVEGLEIKQIAAKHNVDERTVKRWKKAAIDTAEIHFKNYMLCHFNVPSQPLTD
jgi:DNA-directed RNA polymerase specialized sigma24 family protein